VRHQQACQCPSDGIAHPPRLVGQEGHRKHSLQGREPQIGHQRRRVGTKMESSVRRRLSSIFQRPIAGMALVARSAPASLGALAQNPGQQLPVAARPSVMASRADVVAGRVFLDDFYIGGETGAREDALEQIVAEKRRVRRPAGQRRFEGVDVVDALARVRALAEQILVDVRNRRRIGIDSAQAREDALKQRALLADRQRRRDARLQDGVAVDDPCRWLPRNAAGSSGCAILPIRRRTVSRGSRVSASRVTT
jgi:hypothetical protein